MLLLRKALLGMGAAVTAAFLSLGCGGYEPEPEYPSPDPGAAPRPPTAEELAAQEARRQEDVAATQAAQAQNAQYVAAQAENRDIVLGADTDEYAETDPSALTAFRPALEGHGAWVEDPTYGTVWVPSASEVGSDFQPYVTAGHWTYSDETDYVWVSDYSWGWAPFHYGRWVYVAGPGWAWIPGRRYAGAWVTWRVGPAGFGYVGWAPMAPSWYWWGGAPYAWSFGWYHPYDYYAYCPHQHFYGPHVGGYVVRGPAAREFYGRTAEYVPARPGVGGTGGGTGRVIASPSVGGTGHVVASPTVGGTAGSSGTSVRSLNNRGPKPDELGMNRNMIVAPPQNHAGLQRAAALSTPRSTLAAASAGVGRAPASSAMLAGTHTTTIPSSSPTNAVARAPSYVTPSHGASSAGVYSPTASAPRTFTPNASAAAHSAYANPAVHSSPAPAPYYRPTTRGFAQSMRSGGAPPAFHSSASTSGIRSSASAPSFHSSAPSFHSSAPSFHSSASSFRSSSSAPIRSSGGGARSSGGGHHR